MDNEEFKTLAERERNQAIITDIQVYKLKKHAIQSIIRVKTSAGIEGIGEAGLPASVVQGYLDFMRDRLLGMDALEIEKCYAYMTRMQAQWHAHWVQNPTISGIENALYDIAGKVFDRSVSQLLTGRFRDDIEMYINTAGPEDWFDPISCRDWAAEIKANPYGYKFGFERMNFRGGRIDPDRHQGGFLAPMLKPTELHLIQQGYENCREALGWDIDFIVHCHNEWDLASAVGITEAVASSKPLWVEDGLPVLYSDTWKAYRQAARVRVMTGEKLEHPAEFYQFMANGAVDAIHPDLAFIGGFTGGRKIADMAEKFYIPLVTHMAGSYVHLIATAHFGAMVRNFVMTESHQPKTQQLWEEMSEEGVTIKDGRLKVPNGPGLGITLIPEVMNSLIDNGRWD
ncbi:MAG: mandelate racemase/muconate lactonizing enzyme family protein [bacterium]|nr:mandelate racemase/muconate lactonizing enzyme family protein [bacterium]